MSNLDEATLHDLAPLTTPERAPEIAAALRAGGCNMRSTRFATIVATMLRCQIARGYGIRPASGGKRWEVRL